MAAHTGIAGSTKVGRNCMFGGHVGIAGHITIGDYVNMGAMSGVHSNIKPNKTVLGAPAMDIAQAAKVFAVFRNLPGLRDQVIELQKQVKQLASKLEE
jgi:UDP-3-O-[3-hydroxymyristoyl] glucosamine N-acyltransferase